jgi:hypothetical protein
VALSLLKPSQSNGTNTFKLVNRQGRRIFGATTWLHLGIARITSTFTLAGKMQPHSDLSKEEP